MMASIAEILCPVDFSDIARSAAAIARRYGARLTLLHVFVNLPTMDVPRLVLAEADREDLTAKARQMAVHAARSSLALTAAQALNDCFVRRTEQS